MNGLTSARRQRLTSIVTAIQRLMQASGHTPPPPTTPPMPSLLFHEGKNIIHESVLYSETPVYAYRFLITDGFKVVAYIRDGEVFDLSSVY